MDRKILRRTLTSSTASGPIVGTLAGAAPPWSESTMAPYAPSELDPRAFPVLTEKAWEFRMRRRSAPTGRRRYQRFYPPTRVA